MNELQSFSQLLAAGRHQDALKLAQSRQQQSPLDPDWINAVALALHAGDDSPAAIAWMGRALALAPERADLQNNFGVILRRLGLHAEAIAAYRRALRAQPHDFDAQRNLVRALTQEGLLDDAAAACRQFCADNPDSAQAWQQAGHAELARKEMLPAAEAFQRACELESNDATNWRGLAQALNARDQLAAGEAALREALCCAPEDAEIINDLGANLAAAGRHDEALACYDAALARDPGYAKARYNRSTLLLRRGDFTAGWRDYEARLEFPETRRAELTQPLWDGRPFSGELLVHAEQGLGDTLQFLRLLPLVRQRCTSLTFEVQAALLPLLSTLPGADRVIARGQPLPPAPYRVPLLSLPQRLGLTLADLPVASAYLPSPPAIGESDPDLFPADRLKVGLVWAGNPKHSDDRHRSLAADDLRPLLAQPGCRFYSLQFGVDECPLPGVTNLAPQITDWRDTARLLGHLDLLISVDTSVAHLAAAQGQPVWMLIAARSDWRWLEERQDSPWYPSLRLFRQPRGESWQPCLRDVAAALAEQVDAKQQQQQKSGRVPPTC